MRFRVKPGMTRRQARNDGLEDLVDGLLEVVEGRGGSLVARAEAAARAVTATVLAAHVVEAAEARTE